jgi:hypothetical protein
MKKETTEKIIKGVKMVPFGVALGIIFGLLFGFGVGLLICGLSTLAICEFKLSDGYYWT